jgi:phage-related protein
MMMIQGTFGVIQGIFSVIHGTFGVIQGTFSVIHGAFGMIQMMMVIISPLANLGCGRPLQGYTEKV